MTTTLPSPCARLSLGFTAAAPVLTLRTVLCPRCLPRRRRRIALSAQPARRPPPTPPSPPTPLPPSSRAALTSATFLSFTAALLPAGLALHDAAAQHTPFLAHLHHTYLTHYLILLYTGLFAALHSGLASLRPHLTPLVGERAYRVVFALASLPSAAALIAYFIAHRYDGTQLWSLQGVPGVHAAVYAATFVSFLLLYPATFNLAEVAAIARPGFRMYETGVTRVSRHPQLWGQVLWCVAHSAWMGTSFSVVASLALIAHHCFGAWNGDRRQRDAFGDGWLELEKRTSILPFVAVADGRQKLRADEFLRPAYLGVVAFILAAYAAHPYMLRLAGELPL